MTRKIGFDQVPDEWEGPLMLQCQLDKGHSSIRYKAELVKQEFTIYPPFELLGECTPSNVPSALLITIGRAKHLHGNKRFKSEIRDEDGHAEHIVYYFLEEKVNSVRYETKNAKGNTSLYVPNEVFKGLKYPKRLFLAVSLPSEGDGK